MEEEVYYLQVTEIIERLVRAGFKYTLFKSRSCAAYSAIIAVNSRSIERSAFLPRIPSRRVIAGSRVDLFHFG